MRKVRCSGEAHGSGGGLSCWCGCMGDEMDDLVPGYLQCTWSWQASTGANTPINTDACSQSRQCKGWRLSLHSHVFLLKARYAAAGAFRDHHMHVPKASCARSGPVNGPVDWKRSLGNCLALVRLLKHAIPCNTHVSKVSKAGGYILHQH
eukprot:1157971-Pelagomonas_calceolata.AAC.2